jgi:hypothetical protein
MIAAYCPDGSIRGYRLLPPAEIGKWEETAEVRCDNGMTARYFAPRFVSMVSQIFAVTSGPATTITRATSSIRAENYFACWLIDMT